MQLQTKPGQNVVLVGSHPSLGSWSVDDALPMTWSDGHVWKASIELPPDSMDLEYKVGGAAALRCWCCCAAPQHTQHTGGGSADNHLG